jgi:hypothetical protein
LFHEETIGMRWANWFMVAAVTIGLVGCGDTTSDSKKLTLSIPNSVELKPGEAKKATFTITRKGFDEDVKLTIEGLPDGVTAEDKTPTVKKGSKDVEVTFKAAEGAATIEKKDVVVKASGGGLNPEPGKMTVKVAK